MDELRTRIDSIDAEIIKLLSERLEVAKEIGAYKRANHLEIHQPGRWKIVLETRKLLGRDRGLRGEFVENVWNELHKESLFQEGLAQGNEAISS